MERWDDGVALRVEHVADVPSPRRLGAIGDDWPGAKPCGHAPQSRLMGGRGLGVAGRSLCRGCLRRRRRWCRRHCRRWHRRGCLPGPSWRIRRLRVLRRVPKSFFRRCWGFLSSIRGRRLASCSNHLDDEGSGTDVRSILDCKGLSPLYSSYNSEVPLRKLNCVNILIHVQELGPLGLHQKTPGWTLGLQGLLGT